MHISDGVLPTSVALASYAVTFIGATWSIRQVNNKDLPKIAVVTSAFFVASLIHIPFGPTSVHLILPGIVGALLGPVSFLSITLGLFLQSILFQFGGLTALGANALMMGVPAFFCGWLFHLMRGKTVLSNGIAGAVSGGQQTSEDSGRKSGSQTTAGEDFLGVAKIALAAHVPVFIIEAAVSAFTVSFIFRVKPELLNVRRLLK